MDLPRSGSAPRLKLISPPPPSEPDPDKAKLTKALRAAMECIEAAKAALGPEEDEEEES